METISKKNILETVDTAIEYSAKLERNLNSVVGAEQQVIDTAEESLTEIDAAFDELTKSVLDALNKRRETLKKNVVQIQEEGLAPLRACQDLIRQTLKNTQNYICEGQDLMVQRDSDLERNLKYFDQSSLLGSLPAVPNLEEVPAISFQLNVESLRTSLVSRILSAGVVSRMGPVQITSVIEKPGALLVHWEEVEDRGLDDLCFRLQLSVGAHPTPLPRHSAAVFRDVYQGADTSCVVRDVRPGTQHTLRVCCRDERGDWSAWSLPRVAATMLPAFRWSSNNCHYLTTVEGKIATKTDSVTSVLLSSDKQFGPDHSTEFTVLECSEPRGVEEGVGLVDQVCSSESLIQRGCLFLNVHGMVFVDGVEKTTRLPPLVKGSRVTFTCEPLTSSRVRVHIDSGEKTVTYDWRVSSTSFYLAVLMTQPGWKLMVE